MQNSFDEHVDPSTQTAEEDDQANRNLMIAMTVEQLQSCRPDITNEMLTQGGIKLDDLIVLFQGSILPVCQA